MFIYSYGLYSYGKVHGGVSRCLYIVMAYIVTAYIVMACIVMARCIVEWLGADPDRWDVITCSAPRWIDRMHSALCAFSTQCHYQVQFWHVECWTIRLQPQQTCRSTPPPYRPTSSQHRHKQSSRPKISHRLSVHVDYELVPKASKHPQ